MKHILVLFDAFTCYRSHMLSQIPKLILYIAFKLINFFSLFWCSHDGRLDTGNSRFQHHGKYNFLCSCWYGSIHPSKNHLFILFTACSTSADAPIAKLNHFWTNVTRIQKVSVHWYIHFDLPNHHNLDPVLSNFKSNSCTSETNSHFA